MNTLISLKYAKLYGKPLGFQMNVWVGGGKYTANAYVFKGVSLGVLQIPQLIGFAADYTGLLSNSVLLGTSVLFNWKITEMSGNSSFICFEEDIYSEVPNKKFPYMQYVDTNANVFKQYELLDSADEAESSLFDESQAFNATIKKLNNFD
jgi:hypothetical protein